MPRYVTKLVWCGLAVLPLLAQYPGQYPPGGYPPGGYPGGYPGAGGGIPFPFPRRHKKDKSKDLLQQFTGVLNKLDKSSLIVEDKDGGRTTFERNSKTEFLRDEKPLDASQFHIGDKVTVEAREVKEGKFDAVHVIWVMAAQPEEAATGTPGDDDPDRPRLHRAEPAAKDQPAAKDTAAGDSGAKASPAAPAAPSESARADQPSPAEQSLAVGPQAPPGLPPPPAQSGEDPGPPTLHRGAPRARKSKPQEAPQPAAAPAPAAPVQTASVRRPEAPTLPESDPRANDPVFKARQAAAAFTETLPDYVCQEFITRYDSESGGRHPSWRPLDVVSTEVVYEKGAEQYRKLTVDGKPVKKSIEEIGGAWSTGEFGTVLVDLLSPATDADFTFRKDDVINGRSAKVYDYTVDRQHSHWHIHSGAQEALPAYQGSVWIDNQTSRVLRIEMQTTKLPDNFPIEKAESATDYDFVRLGGLHPFLLPVKSEILSCQRSSMYCSLNRIEFRNYHKYTGESTIQFGKVEDTPAPPKK